MGILDIALLPVAIMLFFVYKKDNRKEPTKLLVLLFFLGIGSVILTHLFDAAFRHFFPNLMAPKDLGSLLIHCLIGVALIEEFSKWIMVYLGGYKNPAFDELYDGIVYAIFVSLGFAALENIIYVLVYGLKTGILRAFTSIPGHAAFGLFMGYFFSMAKLSHNEHNQKNEYKYLLLSLIVPIICHGFFDYFVLSENTILIICFVIFIVFLFIGATKKLLKISKENRMIS